MPSLNTIVYSVVGILVGILLVSFIYYVYNLHKDNETLRINNTALEDSLSKQRELLIQKENDLIKKENLQKEYKLVIENLEEEKNKLQSKFYKEKTVTTIIDNKTVKVQKQRDIGKLAVSKPKMVENAINRGTIKEFKCLEAITDNTKTSEEVSNVCK